MCCLVAALAVVASSVCSCQARQARFAAIGELMKDGVIQTPAELYTKVLPNGATLLVSAAEQGDEALVRRLLVAGVDPDGRAYKGNSVPLTRTQSAAVVRTLLQYGADENAVDAAGMTPLGWMASLDNMEGVRALLAAGAEVNPGRRAMPPLLSAGSLGVAAQLIAAGADIDGASPSGTTPLMKASSRGEVALAELYLGAGAQVNAADSTGNTALHVARSVPMVELLAKNGADVRALNTRGESAMFEIMHSAEMVRALASAGVPLDVVSTERKMTALQVMLADDRESDDAILALIAAGADVRGRTPEGYTTVQQASARSTGRRWAIIHALMRAGAQAE